MGGNELLISILISISISLFLLLLYILKKNSINSILENQPNIIFISSIEKILYMNKIALEFFNCKDADDFNKKYHNLANFFKDDKYSYGKKWIESIYKSKKSRAKIDLKSPNDNIEYDFYLQIGKIGKDRYLISLTDITELERDKDMIRKLADYDALTNIYSRVKFNEMLPYYINRALQYNEKLSIILFDIDHFKMINDTYGHNIGDSVLKELTGVVKSIIKDMNIRQNTIFSRWGGEEFVILVQFKTKEETYKLANYIRKEIDRYNFEIVKDVTCSFGVTDFRSSDTKIDMFHRVDNALYRAKRGGRNRVIVD